MSVVGTLCASGAGMSRAAGQANELDLVVVDTDAAGEYVVRRLMPVECERLQGFDDGWTDVDFGGKPATDVYRYKALGNSMAVPVMRWIGERMLYHVAHPITQTFEPIEGLAA